MVDLDAPLFRRNLFGGAKFAALTLGGLFALTGCAATSAARTDNDPEADVTSLNTAIAVEHIGVSAYGLAQASGLLAPRIRTLSLVFRGHHEQHRDAFVAAVERIGGLPVQPKTQSEYAQTFGALENQAAILRLALGIERRAANAYLFMHRLIEDRDLKYLLARFAGDEAMHWGMWAYELGQAAPERAAIFG